MRSRIIGAAAVFAATALCGFAQVVGSVISSSAPAGSFRASMTFSAPRFPVPAVVGQPYSAEQVYENVQTLADGTHITQQGGTGRMYRDSAGRTRIEHPSLRGPNSPPDVPPFVQITDPVAGFEYALDVQHKVAYRFALPSQPPQMPMNRGGMGMAAGSGSGAAAPRPAPPQMQQQQMRQSTSESLGSQVIEGVLAEGHRTTRTIPVGAMGNDRPLVSTNEFWYSPDLRMTVLSKHTDPRMGEGTNKLVNISRAEPDPTLFQPPPDYKVVDQTDRVNIEYTR